MLSLRRFQWLTLGLSALLLVALSGAGGYALTSQPAIHQLQASIREYGLAGEQPPNVARVELEWGEQYYSIQRYREAANLYLQALSDDHSDAAIETRAQKDLYQSYVAWLYANPADDAYAEIDAFLEKCMRLSICDAECRSFTRPQAALALYKRGGALLKRGISYCDDAVIAYKDMVARYGDTQAGELAASALAKPVQFTAFVENLPNPQGLQVWLSRKVAPETHDYITYFSEDYADILDSSGMARFPSVAPGLYNFSLLQRDSFHSYFRYTIPRFNPYTATVSPLCNASEVFDYS
jgi:tetratricopeptide (TPR) repeat protein